MRKDLHLRAKLKRLTWPIFIELLLMLLLGVMDTIMLSRLSDNSVAAVGLVNQLLNLVYMVFMVGTMGTTVVCSQYVGAGQHINFTRTVAVSLLFSCLVASALSVGLYYSPEPILEVMDIRSDLLPEASSYLRIVGGFSVLFAMCMTVNAVLRSKGLTFYPMYVSCVVNICNIMGNYILIFGKWGFPALGVEGAALSTVFSRGIALVLLLFILFRRGLELPLLRSFRPFPWDKLQNILKIGLPGGGEMISYSLSQVTLTYFINTLGNDALAARTYVASTVTFVYLFALAIGQGASICVGQLVGQGKNQAAYLMGRYAIRLAMMVSLGMSVLTAASAPFFVPLLTQNAHIAQLCLILFVVDIPLEVGRAVNILGGRILAAVGNPTYPLIVGVTVMWLVATLGGYAFGILMGFGLVGMWVAFILDESIRAVLLIRRWAGRRWQNRGFVQRAV